MAPGYEAVRDQFEFEFTNRYEKHAQLCVYVGTEKVVDIWYSDPKAKNPMFREKEGAKFGPESIQMLWSASKTISAYAFACAVSKGIVTYDQLVCRDWPEFGTDDGKKALTVKEILQHRSGFAVLDVPVDPKFMTKEGLKSN